MNSVRMKGKKILVCLFTMNAVYLPKIPSIQHEGKKIVCLFKMNAVYLSQISSIQLSLSKHTFPLYYSLLIMNTVE